jgi:hypothetical protein
MQPPTYKQATLRYRLEHLRQVAQRTANVRTPTQVDRFCEQLNTWSQSMTPDQRTRRFTTEEIACLAGLVGKHGGRAAHHQIAVALRATGFNPYRDWSVEGRNRRFWKFQGELK